MYRGSILFFLKKEYSFLDYWRSFIFVLLCSIRVLFSLFFPRPQRAEISPFSRFFAHSGKVDNFLLPPRISFPPLSHPFPPRSHSWCTRACTLCTLCWRRQPTPSLYCWLITNHFASCRIVGECDTNVNTNTRFIAMQMRKELTVVQSLRVIIRANIFSIHRAFFSSGRIQICRAR